MKKIVTLFLVSGMLAFNSCSSDDANANDTEKPTIDMTVANAFPTSCATIAKGGTISFKALFKDNEQLGAYSISIHQNFDHHSHDTEVDQCEFDPIKTPVNPWTKTLTFEIPSNSNQFVAEQQIAIPNDIDTGDYHFMIQLTDAQGWATMKGISIKITE